MEIPSSFFCAIFGLMVYTATIISPSSLTLSTLLCSTLINAGVYFGNA
jgi:hypothetical protein